MKLTKQLIGTLFSVASAGLAFGCGCSTENVRIEPVREMIVQRPLCVAERTVAVQAPLCPTGQRSFDFWGPFHTAGRVISSPFVAMGNSMNSSDRYVAPVGERLDSSNFTCGSTSTLVPVGERVTTIRTIKTYKTVDLTPVRERVIIQKNLCPTDLQPVGERVLIRKSFYTSDLPPVGERVLIRKSFYTSDLPPVGERVLIRKSFYTTDLPPVGEQFIIRRSYMTDLQPVGERFIVKKSYHKTTLKPVGERFIVKKSYHKQMLKPVGERHITVQKTYHKQSLKPVGEHKIMLKSEKKPMLHKGETLKKQEIKSTQSW